MIFQPRTKMTKDEYVDYKEVLCISFASEINRTKGVHNDYGVQPYEMHEAVYHLSMGGYPIGSAGYKDRLEEVYYEMFSDTF